MTSSSVPPLEFNGEPPELAGKVCEAFVCEGYEYDGEIVSGANVTYLKFGGMWLRLFFEPWLIFWKPFNANPAPWRAEDMPWNYPHADVGTLAGIVGERLLSYEMCPTVCGSRVEFHFQNGRSIVIEDKDDRASYVVI